MKRLLDTDPMTKTKRIFHFDHTTGDFHVETKSDVEGVVEGAKELRKEDSGNWKGDVHHVASIPNVIWADLQRRGIADNPKRLKKWLNDRDNRAFRTKRGRV